MRNNYWKEKLVFLKKQFMKRIDSLNTHSRYFRLSSSVAHKYCNGMKSPLQNTYAYPKYGHKTFEGGTGKFLIYPQHSLGSCDSPWLGQSGSLLYYPMWMGYFNAFCCICCCGGIMVCKTLSSPSFVRRNRKHFSSQSFFPVSSFSTPSFGLDLSSSRII